MPRTRSASSADARGRKVFFLDRRAFLTSYDPTEDNDAARDSRTHPAGRDSRLCGHQPGILFLLCRSDRLWLRVEAAAQHYVPSRRDGRRGQRPPPRPALADGRNPRAGPASSSSLKRRRLLLPDILERNPGLSRLVCITSGSNWQSSMRIRPRIQLFRNGVSSNLIDPSRRRCPWSPLRWIGIAAGGITLAVAFGCADYERLGVDKNGESVDEHRLVVLWSWALARSLRRWPSSA